MARQVWSDSSPAATKAAARQAATRERNPDSGLGASARATKRELAQAAGEAVELPGVVVPPVPPPAARTVADPWTLTERLAWLQERGHRLLALRQTARSLVGLVLMAGDEEPVWTGVGTGARVTDAEVAEWEGGDAVARWPFLEWEWS